MTEQHTETERLWESGWDGHEKAQLLRMSKLPFIEKIKWLEEAHNIIQNLNPHEVSSSYEPLITNHEAWIFSIRDNGIGIDPEFNQRIFTISQRLHNREEYPDTRIGLAFVI